MTLSHHLPFWKEAPFIRITIPFLVGIILQQELQAGSIFAWIVFIFSSLALFFLRGLPVVSSFRFNWIRGITIHFLLASMGWLVAFVNDGRHDQNSLLLQYRDSATVKVRIEEPLQEKLKSYKATASIEFMVMHDSISNPNGRILLYFPKGERCKNLQYGTTLIIRKSLQPIKNSGNPGGFDYITYCMRQHIYYSVFLSDRDYYVAEKSNGAFITKLIFTTRQKVLDILSKYIPSKKESGFAKALLIGYTDELDKELVQSYSNTGVVHIIAISGLHLGIIFVLLETLVTPLKKKKYLAWLATAIVITGLWSFSFLAGAGPSVIRSAVMFSFIVMGNFISKRSNTLNNLAASAFILLFIHPFWFWDVGFQLSYTAVLSILLFFKPIYNWFYFSNKIVDFAWKLNAVTLSAQVLTFPICMYYFHQLPVYFLFSNLLAVPWSSVILLGEIALCCFAFWPFIASQIGTVLTWLINGLNDYIERINAMPFSIWGPLQISTIQLALIFAVVTSLAMYWRQKMHRALVLTLISLFAIVGIRSYEILEANKQKKIIVYNLQRIPAIDFVSGTNVTFLGNDSTRANTYLSRFCFQPAHNLYRIVTANSNRHLFKSKNLVQFYSKFIVLANSKLPLPTAKVQVDLLILSKNARGDLSAFISKTNPQLVVADGTNYFKQRMEWKRTCAFMGVPYHDVNTDGAVEFNCN